MTDLANLFAGLLAEIDELSLPTLPTSHMPCGNAQAIEKTNVSHTSHISHQNLDVPKSDARKNESEISDPKFHFEKNLAREGTHQKSVGSVGSVGRGAKTPAEIDTYLFPQKIDDVGSVGRDSAPAGTPKAPICDPLATLSRIDWWSDDLLVEPGAPPSKPAAEIALPISVDQVQAGVRRELRVLANHGRTGPEALVDALAITRAKIRNSPKLMPQQTGATHCFVCDVKAASQDSLMPVLSGVPGRHIWIHIGCHEEHIRRIGEAVDEIMQAAGFDRAERSGQEQSPAPTITAGDQGAA